MAALRTALLMLALAIAAPVPDAAAQTVRSVDPAFLQRVRGSVAANPAAAELQVLAYHDVRDSVADDIDADQYAISTRRLVEHFHWLREHGYTPVSVDDVLAAQSGGAPLPERAVLLSFDDGFASVYTHVLPLLELFGYPAVVSIVTSWTDADVSVEQAGRTLTRDDFLSWEQVGALAASGLVELASHSHDMHRGIPGNPQRNEQPAAVTRHFDGSAYETDADYQARIAADLARSASLIERHTGRAPRVVTWPYGAANEPLRETARRLGFRLDLTLGDGANTKLRATLGRHLITANADLAALAGDLLHARAAPLVRAAQVDLDYVYDPDPAQQEANLGALLDRIKALQISHVFLQAFADPDADGGASALYFPNRHLPMRADLFNRAAWQLRTRAGVLVYAWLPLLSFEGTTIDPAWRVMQTLDGMRSVDAASEPRLSPFEPRARGVIADIYRDLAVHADFDGLLFHDDGRLNASEDTNPAALAAYDYAFGAGFSLGRARTDAGLADRLARFKTEALIDFSHELADGVRRYRPAIRTARNLFASALLDPGAERYLAQDPALFVNAYDYVALMAMPYLEGAADPHRFQTELTDAVARLPGGLAATIFELQTIDWRTGRRIPASELAATMRRLKYLGVRHLGYYPDDFITGHPAPGPLRQGMSLARFPAGDAR